jgi:hypothetical protein
MQQGTKGTIYCNADYRFTNKLKEFSLKTSVTTSIDKGNHQVVYRIRNLVLQLHNEQELKQFGNKVTRISGPRKIGLNEETYIRLNLLSLHIVMKFKGNHT